MLHSGYFRGLFGNRPDLTESPEGSGNVSEPHKLQSPLTGRFEERLFHRQFESQVGLTPDEVAVVFQDAQLTYLELNRRANRLARRLQTFGVGRNVLVGICMERSIELLIAIFAVLKAGGAYVPLDPSYPPARLAFMIEDAQMRAILTHAPCLHLCERYASPERRLTRVDADQCEGEKDDNVEGTGDAGDLAYVIYTSGSTGEPKGAMIHHRGLVNYLTWAVKAYDVGAGIGAPVHSSISFDLTITSLFTPLLAGRTVYMLPEGPGIGALANALVRHHNFSLVKLTPAHLALLQQQLTPQEAAGCTRCFVIGGENLLGESIQWWQQHAPDTVLVNEYGPTETVVGCCVFFAGSDRHFNGSVPIGRPISNTSLYILDANRHPVPPGEIGELYIGGEGVGMGYLHRPALTSECFIPDPFSANQGARIYKTGDLVRRLPDENIEFLGRADHQVNIRGFRVELGEIEAVLAQHPAVRAASVAARRVAGGEQRLVAYVVPAASGLPLQSEFRKFLGSKLPVHFLPSAFVTLDALPLTPNGKVDQAALPEPTWDRSGGLLEPPSTDSERQLVAIWEQVLQVRPIGIRDDFFDLGGHSLLAIEIAAEIKRILHKEVSIAWAFKTPTIAALAKELADCRPQPGPNSILSLNANGDRKPFFCVCGFFDLARHLGVDQPFYQLGMERLEQIADPASAFRELAAHLIEKIRSVQGQGPYLLGGHSTGAVVAFEVACQLKEQGQEVDLLALLDPDLPRPTGLGVTRRTFSIIMRYGRYLFAQGPREQWRSLLASSKWHLKMASVKRQAAKSFSSLSSEDKLLALEGAYSPAIFQGRILLFLARDEKASTQPLFEPRLDWVNFAAGGASVHLIPGDHETFLREPNVGSLAQFLRKYLDAVQEMHGSLSGTSASLNRRP